MNRIIVQWDPMEPSLAVVENGRLTEFYVQKHTDKQIAGNVYKGRVANVLPGMQAAFVDIGQQKNAFLYVDELLPPTILPQTGDRPSIAELVSEGQEIVVQVMKEAFGTKGARVTTRYSLPGKWIVYMPTADYVAISRKITNEAERERLRTAAEEMKLPGEGFIVRTAADGNENSMEAIRDELEHLRDLWREIREKAMRETAPAEVYREPDMIPRLLRDVFSDRMDELVVDDRQACAQIRSWIEAETPALTDRIRLYEGDKPVFETYGVSSQLAACFDRKIWMDSGSYLVIDETEALTVIDVNTGKYTGSVNLEETVFDTNLEAAEWIARLLRLRNIGGIVIVDFIDMKREDHRDAVLRRIEELVKRDRTKCVVMGWTNLGLLEITRKKVRHQVTL